MAGKKIIELPSLGRDLISTDLLEVSVNGTGSYKITGAEILGAVPPSVNPTSLFIPYNYQGVFGDSRFSYESNNREILTHTYYDQIFGPDQPNLLLDSVNKTYIFGESPSASYYPIVGMKISGGLLAINNGNPNPPIVADSSQTSLYSAYGSGGVSAGEWNSSIYNYNGGVSINGASGVTIGSNYSSVSLQGYNVYMNSQTNIGIFAENIAFWNANMFDSSVRTPSGRYFKIKDENGVDYYIPMYQ